MDEFKEEREALKHGTWKQKLSYFWLYFKWRVIAGAFILFFVVSLIHSVASKKPDALSVAFINANPKVGAESYLDAFATQAHIDTEKSQINVDSALFIDQNSLDQTSLLTGQKILVNIVAADLDILASDLITFPTYAYQNFLTDLRTVLTTEELAQYQQHLYYMDGSIAQMISSNEDLAPNSNDISYPDPTKPEEMKDPIPIAIFANASPNFSNAYEFSASYAPLGIIVNAPHKDMAIAFLRYILDDLPVTE